MKARKCDRCGGFYVEYNDVKYKGEYVNAISLQRQFCNKEIYSDRLTYDLCPECMKAVIAFMEIMKHEKD